MDQHTVSAYPRYTNVKVIGGPAGFRGQIYCIEDTAFNVMGNNMTFAVLNYLRCNPPSTGTAYYGKINGMGYVMHESWLEK